MAFIRVKHNNMENEFSAFTNYERNEEWKDEKLKIGTMKHV